MITAVALSALWIFLSVAWPALLGAGCVGTWGRINFVIYEYLWSRYGTALVLIWAAISSLLLSFTEEAVQAMMTSI